LLVGPGANQFAEELGIERVPRESLVSERAIRELECYKANGNAYGNTVGSLFKKR
jgi:hypothetical protein